jgi:uncharacterized protein (DUF1015 family)
MESAPDRTSKLGVRPAHLHIVDGALASRVAAPAYDFLSRAERSALHAAADPLSYLNVVLTPTGSDDLDAALRANRAALGRLLHANVFHDRGEPRFAWYRLAVAGHEQTALVAEVAITDYDQGRIVPHEHTRTDREELLAAHLDVVGASSSPVALAHRADDDLRAIRRRATAGDPQVRFTSSEGVEHTIWTTEDSGLIAEIAAAVQDHDRLYITDGYHRFAAAARVAARRRAGGAAPDAPDQWLLAALFPADELRILPFHRAVLRPRSVSTHELRARLADHVSIQALPGPATPDRPHHYVAYLDGGWYALAADTPDSAPVARPIVQGPLERLDVVVLQRHILEPVFGVTEPRIDPRLHYVAGGPDDVRLHCDHEHAVGFVVRPTSMDELMAVADAGLVMPPKSTLFDPKTRVGVLLRLVN